MKCEDDKGDLRRGPFAPVRSNEVYRGEILKHRRDPWLIAHDLLQNSCEDGFMLYNDDARLDDWKRKYVGGVQSECGADIF